MVLQVVLLAEILGPLKCYTSHDMTKTNKMSVHPAKTQISLGIRQVGSESSLCAQWVAKDPSFLHADSEDSDQTERMPRLIWVFAGRTLILLVLSCAAHTISGLKSHILLAWYAKSIQSCWDFMIAENFIADINIFIIDACCFSFLYIPVEQIRWVFEDNWRIIFISSP